MALTSSPLPLARPRQPSSTCTRRTRCVGKTMCLKRLIPRHAQRRATSNTTAAGYIAFHVMAALRGRLSGATISEATVRIENMTRRVVTALLGPGSPPPDSVPRPSAQHHTCVYSCRIQSAVLSAKLVSILCSVSIACAVISNLCCMLPYTGCACVNRSWC